MTRITTFFILLLSINAYANEVPDTDKENNHNLSSEIEFGYQSNSGNTESKALNFSLDFEHTSKSLRNTGELSVSKAEEDNEEDKNQKLLKLQSDYKLSSQYYFYSNLYAKDTKYSSYFKDISVSPGFGYQWKDTDNLIIETEIGIGYRYQEPNFDEIDDDDLILPENVNEPIVRFNFFIDWFLNDSVNINFESTITTGESNTRYDNNISIETKLNEKLSFKIKKEIDYLNRVPPGLKNKDSELNFTFVYNFN